MSFWSILCKEHSSLLLFFRRMRIVIMISRIVLRTRTIRTRFFLQMKDPLFALLVLREFCCRLFPIPFVYNFLHVILSGSWTFLLSLLFACFLKPRTIPNIPPTRQLRKPTLTKITPHHNKFLTSTDWYFFDPL